MKKNAVLIMAVLAAMLVFVSAVSAQELLYSKHGGRELYYKLADGRILVKSIQGGNLANVPDYAWWYGCSPTSTGMMMGFYDRNGYGGLEYPNLVPGGTAELSNYGNSSALANASIASSGHIAAFYSVYDSTIDPNPGSHPSGSFDCLADFMCTSQYGNCSNKDGATTFWNYNDGTPITPAIIEGLGASYILTDGMYGIKEYLEYRGYSYTTLKSQRIYNAATAPFGFTYANFKAEIDAGRPVLVHIVGHTMLGWGYSDSPTPNTIFVRDTWTESDAHTMTWDGTYDGQPLSFLTCLTPSGGSTPTPEDHKPLPHLNLLLLD